MQDLGGLLFFYQHVTGIHGGCGEGFLPLRPVQFFVVVVLCVFVCARKFGVCRHV